MQPALIGGGKALRSQDLDAVLGRDPAAAEDVREQVFTHEDEIALESVAYQLEADVGRVVEAPRLAPLICRCGSPTGTSHAVEILRA